MASSEWTTVKVSTATRRSITQVAEAAAAGGWQALGVDRSDKPTIDRLIDEAIRRLLPPVKLPKNPKGNK